MELYQALVELFKALDGAKKCTSGAIRLQYSTLIGIKEGY